jgi:methylase of polypeptide subunit release factors
MASSLWEEQDFSSIGSIFNFFKKYNYKIGDSEPVLAQDVFKLKNIVDAIKSLYLVVDEDAILQVWLIEAPDHSHLKTWRDSIANAVKGKMFDLLIFFTEDYSQYYFVSICGDDIIDNIPVFNPSQPCQECDRLIENLANRRPIIDSSGLLATVAQARHELYAKTLLDAINSGDPNQVKMKLSRVGLRYGGKLNFFLPRDEAPLKYTLIDIVLEGNIDEIIQNRLGQYTAEYLQLSKQNLQYVLIIHSSGIYVYDSFGKNYGLIQFSQDELEITLKILTSFITCVDSKVAFNSRTFEAQFGPFSPFYIIAQTLMNEFLLERKEHLEIIRKEWLRNFGKVYRTDDLSDELYVKHAYLSLLIKIVLFSKYLPEKDVITAKSFEDLASWFENRRIELFLNDFYNWAMSISPLINLLFMVLRKAKYEADDIFRVIYQDMVSPSTRHALGEFYTPPELARLMIDYSYKPGQVVLDPACGSGTFLIEIMSKIRNEGISVEDQVKSINSLYGFDVNPIAVLVAKANLLLHCEDLFSKGIAINIFLTDSLFPIERITQTNVDLGEYEIFVMGDKIVRKGKNKETIIEGSVGVIKISAKLLTSTPKNDYREQFIMFLRYLDVLITNETEWKTIERLFNKRFTNEKFPWLETDISPTSMEHLTFRSHVLNIGKVCFDLAEQDQNHIWLYLLYNAIGARGLKNKVDLIIGNPPWLVLNGINSTEYKEKVKELANSYDIMMGGKYATHTEITSIFFYECANRYLKDNELIFFVTTAGLTSGDQHSKFRRFNTFGDVFIWQFDEDIFRIHNVCIGMVKKNQLIKDRLKIPVTNFHSEIQQGLRIFQKKNDEIYIPYNYDEIQNDSDLVKRLIPMSEKAGLLPQGISFYHDLFFQGASIFPRGMFFVIIENEEPKNRVRIKPNETIQNKPPWNFKPYDETVVERDYIYDLVKSTELVPFRLLSSNSVFLPIEKEDFQYHADKIKPLAKQHFEKMKQLYKDNQKEGASITDLWEQINYQNKLSNPRQKGEFKVLFPSAGGLIKSALIKGDIIVDSKFYYYSPDSLDEAYYLVGILNSKSITEDLKKRGATGHGGSLKNYHKKPLEYPFPKYDSENELHKEISEKAKSLEDRTIEIIGDWIKTEGQRNKKKASKKAERELISEEENEEVSLKAKTIQNLILKKLDPEFNELDALILRLLSE